MHIEESGHTVQQEKYIPFFNLGGESSRIRAGTTHLVDSCRSVRITAHSSPQCNSSKGLSCCMPAVATAVIADESNLPQPSPLPTCQLGTRRTAYVGLAPASITEFVLLKMETSGGLSTQVVPSQLLLSSFTCQQLCYRDRLSLCSCWCSPAAA